MRRELLTRRVRIITSLLIFLISTLLLSCAEQYIPLSPDEGDSARIDPEITCEFTKTDKVRVTIVVKDSESAINDIFNQFSSEDLNITRKGTNWFGVVITQPAFDAIKNESDIVRIEIPKVKEIDNQPTIFDPQILERLAVEERVEVSVILKNEGDDVINLRIQSELIDSLSEADFMIKTVSISGRWISGEISREGLDKLKTDPRVLRIYIPEEAQTQE